MEWISVNERMPIEHAHTNLPTEYDGTPQDDFFSSDEVLAVIQTKHHYNTYRRFISIMRTYNGVWQWYDSHDGDNIDEDYFVTYWMPLPKLPGNDKNVSYDFIQYPEGENFE